MSRCDVLGPTTAAFLLNRGYSLTSLQDCAVSRTGVVLNSSNLKCFSLTGGLRELALLERDTHDVSTRHRTVE